MAERIGKLFIVGTPIGNLEDISLRALRVFKEVDVVAAEDTRHTGRLLAHYQIRKPLLSCHEFNEARRTDELIERLRRNESVAFVSDAGMPTVSDPGQRLVRAAAVAGIPIEIVPGPSAVTMATTLAGLGDGKFFFYGFLPNKASHRRKTLTRLAPLPYSLVFFESPYRVLKSLTDMRDTLGNRQAVVARELTKKFEEVLRGSLEDLVKLLENRRIKGEITVVVEGENL